MSKHLSSLKIPLSLQTDSCKQHQKRMIIARRQWSGKPGPARRSQFTGRYGNWQTRTMWTKSLEVWVWVWRVGLGTTSAELLRIEGVAWGFAVSQWQS